MANEVKPTYDCTMQELYSKTELGWSNCKTQIADFTLKKAFYTALYCDGKIADIAAARLLPEDELRSLPSINLRNDLVELNTPCLDNNQDLKSYIDKAYPVATRNSNYLAAGGTYYRKASNENWENTVGMNDAMIAFINLEEANLLAGNNMPATFKVKVKADALAFKTKYDLFKPASETGTATNAKIKANNLIDADYKEMLKDGKNVYRHDATNFDLFVDEKLLALVSPPGSASLSLTILKDDDSLPAEGAKILLQKASTPPINLLADATGGASQASIDPGVYKVLIDFPGYTQYQGLKEVNKGVNARQTIRLTKI